MAITIGFAELIIGIIILIIEFKFCFFRKKEDKDEDESIGSNIGFFAMLLLLDAAIIVIIDNSSPNMIRYVREVINCIYIYIQLSK